MSKSAYKQLFVPKSNFWEHSGRIKFRKDGEAIPEDDMDAAWQWLMDHASPSRNGFKVTAYVKNKNDFRYRVLARGRGIYRNDEGNMKKEIEEFVSEYGQWKRETKISGMLGRRVDLLWKSGSLYERAIVCLYRLTRDYLRDKTFSDT